MRPNRLTRTGVSGVGPTHFSISKRKEDLSTESIAVSFNLCLVDVDI